MKSRDEISEKEFANYVLCYLADRDVITDSIAYNKKKLKDPDLSDSEEANIEVQLLWLAAELAKLDAKRNAFRKKRAKINPPSDKQVEEAQKLSEESDELIANSKAATKSVALAKKSIAHFKTIQPKA